MAPENLDESPRSGEDNKPTTDSELKKIRLWKTASIIFAASLLLVSTLFAYSFLNNQTISPTDQMESETSLSPTPMPTEQPEIGEWVETDIIVAGVTFEYPKGWHVASYNQGFHGDLSARYNGYHLAFINREPLDIMTTHGFGSEFIIARRNGMQDPQAEFEQILNSEREELSANSQDLNEEVLSSEFFDEIYHFSGTRTQAQTTRIIDKYFMMLTDPKKKASEAISENIIIVERLTDSPDSEELLREIVMSIKECHYTWCLEE